MRSSEKMLGLGALIMALPACAGGDAGRYPSLALRPFESGVTAPAPETGSAVPAIRTPEQHAALTALTARADASHAAFVRQQSIAEPLARAARGLSPDSNGWARAVIALSDLSSHRSATAAALADLDAIAAEAAASPAADPAAIAAQTRIAALVISEDAALTRLWEALGS